MQKIEELFLTGIIEETFRRYLYKPRSVQKILLSSRGAAIDCETYPLASSKCWVTFVNEISSRKTALLVLSENCPTEIENDSQLVISVSTNDLQKTVQENHDDPGRTFTMTLTSPKIDYGVHSAQLRTTCRELLLLIDDILGRQDWITQYYQPLDGSAIQVLERKWKKEPVPAVL